MKLLFVNCCISQRGPASRTAALCGAFLDEWRAANPDAETETADLTAAELRPFTAELLDRRDALARAGEFGAPVFAPARQFRDADRIVVGAPFWDLSFPAALRIYIEYVSANGVTYYYDETGPHGACRARRLCYLTSGGDRERPDSLGAAYWRQLCALYGIPELRYVFAGGLDLDETRAPALLAEACGCARKLAREF